ncbi:MAG: Sec-independent protein translocase, TatC subunit [Solirubrobacterales bacterium]|nr:Sec-independent protein translocase, TatC subunit [Solirubrobacterales bacterium]
MPAVRKVAPIGHEDRLSLTEHLDELRTRLVLMAVTLVISFVVCAWQNQALLHIIGKPLATQTEQRTRDGKGPLGEIYVAIQGVRTVARNQIADLTVTVQDPKLDAATRAKYRARLAIAKRDFAALPDSPPTNKPITIGIGEPFTQTITIAAYFALLFALPLILFQLYAFVLPAFSPDEKRVALPLMAMVPVLFAAGVAFGYFVVLPAATKFLQNFNADQFNVLVQAKDYYKFAILTIASIGLVFQLPVGLLAITRTGIVSVRQLRGWRRYAIVATAVLAMVLPGTDPVSMILEFLILYALYELSLVMAMFMDRGKEQRARSSRWDFDEDDDEDTDEDDLGPDPDAPVRGTDADDPDLAVDEREPDVDRAALALEDGHGVEPGTTSAEDPDEGDHPVLAPPRSEDV